MTKQLIDSNEFREAIRRLPDEQIYQMLLEAVEMLTPSKLERLAKRYMDLTRLRADTTAQPSLLEDVRAFEKASLRGDYYESFDVYSKNFSQMSKGTRAWIAEFDRLLNRRLRRSPVSVPQK